jgi:hypothetical protein
MAAGLCGAGDMGGPTASPSCCDVLSPCCDACRGRGGMVLGLTFCVRCGSGQVRHIVGDRTSCQWLRLNGELKMIAEFRGFRP